MVMGMAAEISGDLRRVMVDIITVLLLAFGRICEEVVSQMVKTRSMHASLREDLKDQGMEVDVSLEWYFI